MTQISDKIIDRIQKLLSLASNNPNEAEAQAAMAKAQEMLAAYNLEMHDVTGVKTDNKRNDKVRKGGLYTWQRKLWKAVAEMNFCHYLSIKGTARGSQYEHRLIGSHANVIATELMAQYLQDTVEKLAQTWAKEAGFLSVFVKDAIAYREGMTTRVTEKLQQRRRELVEEAKQAEELRKRDAARANSAPSGTELTIVDVISSEADFNNDYLNGWEMGTTAKNRHEEELRTKKAMHEYEERQRVHKDRYANDAKYREEYDAKQLANQKYWEDLLAKQPKRRKSTYVSKGPRARAQTAEEKRQGLAGYWDGYDDGNKVGIDTQVTEAKKSKLT